MVDLIAAFGPTPLQFEKDPEEADPFGLDQFLSEVRGGKKRALDDIGKSGERSLGGPSGRRVSVRGSCALRSFAWGGKGREKGRYLNLKGKAREPGHASAALCRGRALELPPPGRGSEASSARAASTNTMHRHSRRLPLVSAFLLLCCAAGGMRAAGGGGSYDQESGGSGRRREFVSGSR